MTGIMKIMERSGHTIYTANRRGFIEKNGAGGHYGPLAQIFSIKEIKIIKRTLSAPVPPPPSEGRPVSSCVAHVPPNSPSYKVPCHK